MSKYSGLWTLSQQAQATTKNLWPRVPGAPTIGTASTTASTQATVTFTAPTDAGIPATITSYTVTSSPGNITATGSASPITVTGLTNGVAYTFTVRATNASGTGPASAASNSVTPSNTKTVQIKVWGAGGGSGNYPSNIEYGGPGGYATATFGITANTVLSIFVGQGGGNRNSGGNPNGGLGCSSSGSRTSGSIGSGVGGGFCGVFVGSQTWANLQSASISSSNALIVAGSGGGASYFSGGNGGGWGGGTTGGAGLNRTGSSSASEMNGSGGTATAGGAKGTTGTPDATNGSLYKGGDSAITVEGTPGGGGGAGWYGGGGATDRQTPTYGSGYGGGGGGGSGMIASVTSGTSLPSGVTSVSSDSFVTQTGTGVTAPNNSDSDYVAGRGVGSSESDVNGGDGLVVVYINGVKTSYSYTGNVQTITV